MFHEDRYDLSQKEKAEANRIARDKVGAVVREVGFDKVLDAVIQEAHAVADALACDLGEAVHGWPRSSDERIACAEDAWKSAHALYMALYKAKVAYENKEGRTLAGYALPRHHGRE